MKDHIQKSIWTFVFFTFLLLVPGLSSAVEVWSFPNETELKTLVVTNVKSQPKDLWLSGPNLENEVRLTVPAFGQLEIPLLEFQQSWLRVVSIEDRVLQLALQSSFESMVTLEPEQTTTWKVRALAGAELVLFNQAPFRQRVEIRTSNTSSGLWKEIWLDAFAKVRVPVGADVRGQVLSINGEARLGGLMLADTNTQRLVANPKPQELSAVLSSDPGSLPPRYFLVRNSENDQSYVVALQDPLLIQQALRQIQLPWETTYLPRILIARVAAGHGGFNRDFSSPWKAPWSWHLAEVYRFADFASQSCDGNPEFLEQTLHSWSPDNQGVICFWNFRITEELPVSRVQKGL